MKNCWAKLLKMIFIAMLVVTSVLPFNVFAEENETGEVEFGVDDETLDEAPTIYIESEWYDLKTFEIRTNNTDYINKLYESGTVTITDSSNNTLCSYSHDNYQKNGNNSIYVLRTAGDLESGNYTINIKVPGYGLVSKNVYLYGYMNPGEITISNNRYAYFTIQLTNTNLAREFTSSQYNPAIYLYSDDIGDEYDYGTGLLLDSSQYVSYNEHVAIKIDYKELQFKNNKIVISEEVLKKHGVGGGQYHIALTADNMVPVVLTDMVYYILVNGEVIPTKSYKTGDSVSVEINCGGMNHDFWINNAYAEKDSENSIHFIWGDGDCEVLGNVSSRGINIPSTTVHVDFSEGYVNVWTDESGNIVVRDSNNTIDDLNYIELKGNSKTYSLFLSDFTEKNGYYYLSPKDQKTKYNLVSGDYTYTCKYSNYKDNSGEITVIDVALDAPTINIAVGANGSLTFSTDDQLWANSVRMIEITHDSTKFTLKSSTNTFTISPDGKSITVSSGLCFFNNGDSYDYEIVYKDSSYKLTKGTFTFDGNSEKHPDSAYLNPVPAKAATADTNGNKKYWYCPVCNKYYLDEGMTIPVTYADVVIQKTNPSTLIKHTGYAATCTENGKKDYWESPDGTKYLNAQATKLVSNDDDLIIEALGHGTLKHVEAVNETCTEDGNVEYYECSRCGKKFSDAEGTKVINNVVIPAKGHDYKDEIINGSTCITHGTKEYTCSRCDDSYTEELPYSAHTLEKAEKKAATCTDSGNIEYYECSVCGKLFSDVNGEKQISKESVIELKNGHVMNKIAAKNATCEEDGNIEYYECSVCEKKYLDEQGNVVANDVDLIIKATGHDEKRIMRSNGGWDIDIYRTTVIDYYCSKCYKHMRTEYERQYSVNKDVDGNLLTEPGYYLFISSYDGVNCFDDEITLVNDYSIKRFYYFTGTGLTSAQNSSHYMHIGLSDGGEKYLSIKQTADWIHFNVLKSGNHDLELILYSKDYEEVARVPIHIRKTCKHNYVKSLVSESTCSTEGEINYVCQNCDDTYTESTPKLAHNPGEKTIENEIEPTCIENGSYDEIVRCTECNEIISSNHVITNALGHSEDTTKVVETIKEPTCIENGIIRESYYCTRCNKVVSTNDKSTDKISHVSGEYELDASLSTEATCVDYGVDVYVSKCIYCGKVIDTKKTYIPVLGHDYLDPIEDTSRTVAATCTEEGSRVLVSTCSRCGKTVDNRTEVIPPLGHNYDHSEKNIEVEEIQPDCRFGLNGYVVSTEHCSRCDEGDLMTYVIVPAEHDWEVMESPGDPISHANGLRWEECMNCGVQRNLQYVPWKEYDTPEAYGLMEWDNPEGNIVYIEDPYDTSALDNAIFFDDSINATDLATNSNIEFKAQIDADYVEPTSTLVSVADERGYDVSFALDINLNVNVVSDGETISTYNVTSLSSPIAVTIDIPDSYMPTDSNDSYDYYILHEHDGIIETIRPDVDTENGTMTFETSGFSDNAFTIVKSHEHNANGNSSVIENDATTGSTCEAVRSYDLVTYCSSNDGYVISSQHVEENVGTGHKASESVIENRVEPTCTSAGSYDLVYYCDTCGKEINRTNVEIEKLDHIESTFVIENRVDATCSTNGSYDSVVYCANCNTEISRQHITTDKTEHQNLSKNEVVTLEPTCISVGTKEITTTCLDCGKTISVTNEDVPMIDHEYDDVLNYYENGENTVTTYVECINCQNKKIVNIKTSDGSVKVTGNGTLDSASVMNSLSLDTNDFLTVASSDEISLNLVVKETESVPNPISYKEAYDGSGVLKQPLNISLYLDSTNGEIDIGDSLTGPVDVTIYNVENYGKGKYYLVHDIDGNNYEKLPATFNNGNLTFTTSSFSTFYLVFEADAQGETQNDKEVNGGTKTGGTTDVTYNSTVTNKDNTLNTTTNIKPKFVKTEETNTLSITALENNKIGIIGNNGLILNDAILHFNEVQTNDIELIKAVNNLNTNAAENELLYAFSLSINSKDEKTTYSIKGTTTICLPTDLFEHGNDINIYLVNDDYSLTKCNYTIEDENLLFETNKLSKFVVIKENQVKEINNIDNSNVTNEVTTEKNINFIEVGLISLVVVLAIAVIVAIFKK